MHRLGLGMFFYIQVHPYFIIIYLMLSPTSAFATRDFVAKLVVGHRVHGRVLQLQSIY